LHYWIEDNTDGPVLVFLPDTLINLHIWDSAVSSLAEQHPEYRIVRCGTVLGHDVPDSSRPIICIKTFGGILQNPYHDPKDEIPLALLVSDIFQLLAHLRISRAQSIIGLGLFLSHIQISSLKAWFFCFYPYRSPWLLLHLSLPLLPRKRTPLRGGRAVSALLAIPLTESLPTKPLHVGSLPMYAPHLNGRESGEH
jgi:hypothetical protein